MGAEAVGSFSDWCLSEAEGICGAEGLAGVLAEIPRRHKACERAAMHAVDSGREGDYARALAGDAAAMECLALARRLLGEAGAARFSAMTDGDWAAVAAAHPFPDPAYRFYKAHAGYAKALARPRLRAAADERARSFFAGRPDEAARQARLVGLEDGLARFMAGDGSALGRDGVHAIVAGMARESEGPTTPASAPTSQKEAARW